MSFPIPTAWTLKRAVMVMAGMMACLASLPAQVPADAAKAKNGKDYSPLRIRGRQMRELPGIGTIHADLIEQAPGGDVVLTGCVFLERLKHFGYAPKARWNPATGVLTLEENWVVESEVSIMEATSPGGEMRIDPKGVFMSTGKHRIQMR